MKRNKIAAANWKMNLTLSEGEELVTQILDSAPDLSDDNKVLFAVPFVYLHALQPKINKKGYHLCAQNISDKESGAFTGEISCAMLKSIDINYALIGHSERREYYNEYNAVLAKKIDIALSHDIHPVFCCGEPLAEREAGSQNDFVTKQLNESLFHLDTSALEKVVIAYEPIWAIGTGKTANKEQAEEMHAHIRSEIAKKYDQKSAEQISILYGGSVKADNAKELFAEKNVDGGLVGGASLKSADFTEIIKALA